MTLVGWLLIVVGVGFVVLGFAGAVLKLVTDARQAPQTRSGPGLPAITDLLKAVTELVKALTAAPQWLALEVVGIGLIGLGGYLIGK